LGSGRQEREVMETKTGRPKAVPALSAFYDRRRLAS